MVFQELFANRWVIVFENELVKTSGIVANIIGVAQVSWKLTNRVDNWLAAVLLCLVNLFQILADENVLHGNADPKTEIIHLSSNHIYRSFVF